MFVSTHFEVQYVNPLTLTASKRQIYKNVLGTQLDNTQTTYDL